MRNDLLEHAKRNIQSLDAWAERYRKRFGVYPQSWNPKPDIDDKARAARMTCCFAEDLIAPTPTADILVHPSVFNAKGDAK